MSEPRRRRSYHEAAHKLAADRLDDATPPRARRSFNEAAHKLSSWEVSLDSRPLRAKR